MWKKDKVLGIIWDGIGFGTSTEIWGGEFFLFENKRIKRFAQLENFAWILGDKMSKSPKISALSISDNNEDLKFAFDENEWKIYTQLIEKSEVKTSSMGRFFDAVSFVLGYEKPIFFEGESAMWLEKISQETFENNIKITDYLEEEKFENIPTKKLFSRILKEKMSGKNDGEIGLNFHYTLIKAIEKTAEKNNIKDLAFSGGVWQNALLVDLAIDVLGEKFSLNFHEKLSPNDENISFGQLNYYLNLK